MLEVEAFPEPKGRASSPLRADGCNYDFLQGKGRRAPVLRSTNAKRGYQPSATAEGGRSDAPYLDQPVHGPNARQKEMEVSHEPSVCCPHLAAEKAWRCRRDVGITCGGTFSLQSPLQGQFKRRLPTNIELS